MAFWSGFAKGLQEYNVRETEDRRIEEDRKFQKDLLWEKVRAERENMMFELYAKRGLTGSSGGGSSKEDPSQHQRDLAFMAGRLDGASNPDEAARLLAAAKRDPKFARQWSESLITREKDGVRYGADMLVDNTYLYETEGEEVDFDLSWDDFNAEIDYSDPQSVFEATQKLPKSGQGYTAAFSFDESSKAADKAAVDFQTDAFGSMVVQEARSALETISDPVEQEEILDAIRLVEGSDPQARATGMDRLARRFGARVGQELIKMDDGSDPKYRDVAKNPFIRKYLSAPDETSENTDDPVAPGELSAQDLEERLPGFKEADQSTRSLMLRYANGGTVTVTDELKRNFPSIFGHLKTGTTAAMDK